jgi:plasmid maintenance system antidote protein VapI
MTTRDISDVLRQAIKNSGVPLLVLERETGVQRASIRRFIDNKQSLRLDVAAKLAAHFGLELVKRRKAR